MSAMVSEGEKAGIGVSAGEWPEPKAPVNMDGRYQRR